MLQILPIAHFSNVYSSHRYLCRNYDSQICFSLDLSIEVYTSMHICLCNISTCMFNMHLQLSLPRAPHTTSLPWFFPSHLMTAQFFWLIRSKALESSLTSLTPLQPILTQSYRKGNSKRYDSSLAKLM